MNKQIGVSVVIFVLFIEALILISSYSSRKEQLVDLKVSLERDVYEKTGKDFHDLHPGILDDEHIESLMNRYLKNILLLSLLIASFTAIGTVVVFDFFVGRHILRLKRFNKLNRGLKVARWREPSIPNNEVGELILEREKLLDRIEEE
ncbi:hypothetical protein [Halobacteriovorax sp.]|uniref:hypothetical protein n=1 Tax=Halobacteriovorax sp. TaxID=2020862 RepID=UPI003AF2E951